MRRLILFTFLCIMAVNARQSQRPGWDLLQTYTYSVKGDILSGIGSNGDHPLSYNIHVTRINEDTIFLKPSDFQDQDKSKDISKEIEGPFSDSGKSLSPELLKYLSSPIEVTYREGRFAAMKIEGAMPTWAVNIKKSQMASFVVNLESVAKISGEGTAEIREKTVYGKCQVHYEVRESGEQNLLRRKVSQNLQSSESSSSEESQETILGSTCKENEMEFIITRSFRAENCEFGPPSPDRPHLKKRFILTKYTACGSRGNYDIVEIGRAERNSAPDSGEWIQDQELVHVDQETVLRSVSPSASVNQLERINSPEIYVNLAYELKQHEQANMRPVFDEYEEVEGDTYVTIKNGTLKGTISKSDSGRLIYNYRSIPYAKPPLGELRFEPPQVLTDGWPNTILDATQNPPSCLQPSETSTNEKIDEDCLYLNVYTPRSQNNTKNPLPVMVFMHGGAFVFGDSGIYGPDKLLANDVILVVPHYRLGVLGFFSTGDSVVPGNNGMKDVVQALRWVKENIGAFGGDPNKVTIFGESAGGAGSLLVLLSPLAKGLFHRVISQSGTPLAQWSMDRTPKESAQRFGKGLECPTDTSTKLVACLRGKSATELVDSSLVQLLFDLLSLNVVFDSVAPVIEPDHPGAFLSKDPLQMFEDGSVPDVPIMLGTVQHEGLRFLELIKTVVFTELGDDPIFIRDKMVPTLLKGLGLKELDTGGAPISQSLILAYLPNSPRNNFTEAAEGTTDMLSTTLFKAPDLRSLETLLKRPGSRGNNIYLYSFEYQGAESFLQKLMYSTLARTMRKKVTPLNLHGVGHADDLQYFFTLPVNITGKDREFSILVCKIWTDFARTGNPTPSEMITYPKWPAYTLENKSYYKLVLNPQVKEDYTKNWVLGFASP